MVPRETGTMLMQNFEATNKECYGILILANEQSLTYPYPIERNRRRCPKRGKLTQIGH